MLVSTNPDERIAMTATPLDELPPVGEIVDRYFAAWNAPADERLVVVAAAYHPDAFYCDGATEAAGRTAIGEMVAGVAEQFPGARFERISPIDVHHRQCRFAWRMIDGDGASVIDGIDAMRFTDRGEISEVLGFFGVDLPPATDSGIGAVS